MKGWGKEVNPQVKTKEALQFREDGHAKVRDSCISAVMREKMLTMNAWYWIGDANWIGQEWEVDLYKVKYWC